MLVLVQYTVIYTITKLVAYSNIISTMIGTVITPNVQLGDNSGGYHDDGVAVTLVCDFASTEATNGTYTWKQNSTIM